MRFQIPQFIETETKIVGPFTLSQFVYIAGGTVLVFILRYLLESLFGFLIFSVVIAFISIAFAFYKINGLTLANYIGQALAFVFGSKKYIFVKDKEGDIGYDLFKK